MIGLLQRSLKARITLFSLAIFLLSLSALDYVASKLLHRDMERVLGTQQFSTVTLVAANINDELTERLAALKRVADALEERERQSPATLQLALEHRPILPVLFNGGFYVTDAAGTAIASLPAERIGVNYLFHKNVAAALGEGKAGISGVTIGKVLRVPVFNLAVPVRDPQGKIIGSLVGVINLGTENFLDKITSHTYGLTGGYLLLSPEQRLVVTGTDKRRIMEALPPAGVTPALDDFLAGHEGSAIFRKGQGVEMLASAKRIPVTGWYALGMLPTDEAFAPVHGMQRRISQITLLLAVIAGGLTWQMLRHQLAPLAQAAKAISTRPGPGLAAQPLPVTTQDEIGQLIGSFNTLLGVLATREAALAASESRFTLFMDYLPGAAFIKQEDGLTLYANRYMMDVLGARDWQGKSTRDLFPPAVAEKMIADDLRALARGQMVIEEAVHTTDGRLRHYQTHKFTMPSPGPHLLLGGIALDISDRKQAEESLRKSEEQYRVIIENSPVGIFQTDAQGDCLYVNPRWTEISGLTLDEALGKGWSQALHPEDRQKVIDSWHEATMAGSSYDWECRFLTPQGKQVWTAGHAELLRDEQGNRRGFHGFIVDTTSRKQAEAVILRAETRFQAIIEASPVPFALNDSAMNITFLNGAFTRAFGYDRTDIPTLEAWWPKAYPDDTYGQQIKREWSSRLERARREARPFEPMEVRLRCKDGGDRIVLVTATPIESSFDDLHLVTLYDITDRKKSESLMREQLDELQRWHQAMLGREERIISMKREVNELLSQAGLPPRYSEQPPVSNPPAGGPTPTDPGGRLA